MKTSLVRIPFGTVQRLAKCIVVGPLVGYQPRRKQVVEVRKLFEGYQIGEISLFYELEAKPPSPGEELFEE